MSIRLAETLNPFQGFQQASGMAMRALEAGKSAPDIARQEFGIGQQSFDAYLRDNLTI